MASSLADWERRLARLAEGSIGASLAGSPADAAGLADAFRDDLGHRRPEDGAFLRAHLGLPPPPTPTATPESRLWALAGTPDAAAPPDPLIGPANAEGPLLLGHETRAIEVATDAELCAIHALWAIGERTPAWRDRALAAARWCVDELQPDNATNEPWAIHVFLMIDSLEGDAAAGLYAQTLLHNAMVAGAGTRAGGASGGPSGGPLPARSAWIIRDAAMRLRREVERDERARSGRHGP
ncbi:MAG: hypothetical protein KDA05_06445 [Phycisphaerales bacterium]|nr:hypothetical protein [Phycisphaerales bacterium]MCB9840419.1 hypothetical protein [Phycisphaeraceae bacterium]